MLSILSDRNGIFRRRSPLQRKYDCYAPRYAPAPLRSHALVSTDLVFCSLNFTADLFTNKAQFDAGFSKRLKLKDDAVPTILDQTVVCIVINSFYYMVTIALSVK